MTIITTEAETAAVNRDKPVSSATVCSDSLYLSFTVWSAHTLVWRAHTHVHMLTHTFLAQSVRNKSLNERLIMWSALTVALKGGMCRQRPEQIERPVWPEPVRSESDRRTEASSFLTCHFHYHLRVSTICLNFSEVGLLNSHHVRSAVVCASKL